MSKFHLFFCERLATVAKFDRWDRSNLALVCLFGLVLFVSLVVSVPPVLAANGNQPFVLHETFERQGVQSQSPNKINHGIVGLELLIQPGKFPRVQGVFPGTPAANQGFLPGDQILTINGISTLEKSATEVDTLISDVPGERVLFSIQRGTRRGQVSLTVVALDSLPSLVRSDFSGLFTDYP